MKTIELYRHCFILIYGPVEICQSGPCIVNNIDFFFYRTFGCIVSFFIVYFLFFNMFYFCSFFFFYLEFAFFFLNYPTF